MKSDFLEILSNTQEHKLRRRFYELVNELDVVDINKIPHWKEMLIRILENPIYRKSQGIEHLFFNLLSSELNENELDFIVQPIINFVDDFNVAIFLSLSELLKGNLSKESISNLIKKLKRKNTQNSILLINFLK